MPEYNIIFKKQFFVRVGITSENESLYEGYGASWKVIRIETSAGYHRQLGISTGLFPLQILQFLC
jgi:hypothetical protein